jgi:predicted ATPase
LWCISPTPSQLAQSRTQDHPHTLAQALSFAALLQRWLNRQPEAQALAAEAIAISRQHDFHLWRACGEMTHGWARVMQGQADGLAEIESSIATMRKALGGMSVVFLSSQIEACMHLQQFDRALALTAQALADAAKTGDAHFLPELYRLKGVCLLSLDAANAASARACLQQALAISGQQNAKPMALRAATSLLRLGGSPDQIRAAQQDLQAIYQSFTEGWYSHDLQQAAACLLVGPDAST